MLESEGRVYVYSTGGGAKSSADGLVWRAEPSPPWALTLPNNQGLWAPDGIFLNGQFYLYGAMWSAAKASAVTLMTSPTLDPSSPNYKWIDRGVAISGPVGVTHSVIDAAPVLDASGKLWLVWGGGYPFPTNVDSIFVTRLDNQTGLPLTTDPGWNPPASPGYPIAQGHKEGPYIHYHGGFYYLFYQTGSCCSGAASTYTIHVARASAINGPYGGDQTFYASTGGIHGPGHIGIYAACGFERFTYHYYPDTGGSILGENELLWTANGWPAVGPASTTPLKLCGSDSAGGAGGQVGGVGGNGPEGTGGSPGTGGAAGSVVTGTGGSGGAGTSDGSGGSTTTGGLGGDGGSGDSPGSGGDGTTAAAGCACDVRGTLGAGRAAVSGSLTSISLCALALARRRRRTRP
jgi:hypothetical protein